MTNQIVIIETYDPTMVAVRYRPGQAHAGYAWVVRELIKTDDDKLGFVTVEKLPENNKNSIFVESYFVSELMTREEWDKLKDDRLQDEIDRLCINQKNN
jgi:hypothetical protein